MMIGNWYEVWVDDSSGNPYLLIVSHAPESTSHFVVIDPKEGYRIIHRSNDYEEIKLWLLEDEYSMVDGRMIVGE